MKIKLHTSNAPAELIVALEKKRLTYTDALDLFYCIPLSGSYALCGVFGDGENGAYEWFIWDNGKLETSDCAYGMASIALRDVLNRWEEPQSHEECKKALIQARELLLPYAASDPKTKTVVSAASEALLQSGVEF